MKGRLRIITSILALLLVVSFTAFGQGKGNDKKGGGTEPTAGNNLSYPVIWADENYTKTLRGTPGLAPITTGAWWWWWGIIEGGEGTADVPLSCAPDPDNNAFCDDGVIGTANGDVPGEGFPADVIRKAYLQKDFGNTWQAGTLTTLAGNNVNIDWIDWGDDLESKDWTLSSQVRIEHVLLAAVGEPLTEYVMRHTSGWGTNEVHGLSVEPTGPTVETLDNYLPTIYSACARLTIQRLTVTRDDPTLDALVWDTTTHQWTGVGINAPILNSAAYEAGDGPGYYGAEVNVKGKLIYGYTWNVRKLNQGAADYRVTFSFDSEGCTAPDNTFITSATQILLPEEVEELAAEEEPIEGGVGVLRSEYNLTYMDVRIGSKKGGGKKER